MIDEDEIRSSPTFTQAGTEPFSATEIHTLQPGQKVSYFIFIIHGSNINDGYDSFYR